MKIFRLSFMSVSLLLSACSYAASSSPTATGQASPIVLPSREVTSTALLLPSPTETSTREPVAVTNTFQPTDTPLPTLTPTPGLVMEIVQDAPQVIIPPTQAQGCGRPPHWPSYRVQHSDTLSSLAQRTGTSVQQIQVANCLTGTLIFAGQILNLPFVPASQAGTSVPSTGPIATIQTPEVGLPGDHHVNISPSSGPPGTEFTLSVDEYASNEKVIITITSVETNLPVLEQTLYTDDAGNLTWYFKSPVNMPEGAYKVYEDGVQSNAAGKGDFSITPPPATTSP